MRTPLSMLPTELCYFEEVARRGSIREAAESLNIAGSAISRQISRLEADLGATLFKRTSFGMKLTQAGRVLLEHVEKNRDAIDHTRLRIRDIVDVRSGDLIIFHVDGLIDDLLLSSIEAFSTAYRKVEVILRATDTQTIIDSLQNNLSDIGFALNPPRRLEVESIGRIEQIICAVIASGHPKASLLSPFLTLDGRIPIAVPEPAGELGAAILRHIEAEGTSFTPAMTANSISLIKNFAIDGHGVSLLPRSAVEKEVRAGTLRSVPLREPTMQAGAVHICQRRDCSHSVAADAFLKIVQAKAAGDR